MAKSQEDQGVGDYFVEEDGSMTRIGEVPAEAREMANKKGYKLKPDHIPAEEVEKYTSLRVGSNDADKPKDG